ncbi:MAG: NUDIX hydrolase [Bacilli bacterium]|nr:NUDIX hydrolase [Bacilli bacterium]
MNFATNKLIAHGLMKIENRYLVIKRTAIKRGKPNAYPEYWNIPGGMVEPGETPVEGVIREVKEEVNLDIKANKIIHEDSNFDTEKNCVFTRLVYECYVLNNKIEEIKLDPEEHTEYKLITGLDELKNEKIVDYLKEILD